MATAETSRAAISELTGRPDDNTGYQTRDPKDTSQPFYTTTPPEDRVSSADEGKYVPVADTIKSFQEIIDGKHDDLPEQAFYMVGGIDDVVEKARAMQTA